MKKGENDWNQAYETIKTSINDSPKHTTQGSVILAFAI